MAVTNNERISRALDYLRDGLKSKCEELWQSFLGDDWIEQVNSRLHHPDMNPSTNDISSC